MNRNLREDIQMAKRFMKNCFASSIIIRMQIKTTIRFPLTTVSLIHNKNKSWLEWMWEKESLIHCW